ncbi:MAG: hypothetical protein GYB67_13110 [Chloroflexi bacterium]|nr:hypothetical protein [Chloroflexota bacterium]
MLPFPPFPPVLAHGALGWFDELLFVGIAVIFFVMMGISWVRSRAAAEQEAAAPDAPTAEASDPAAEPDRFRLE